MINQMNCVNTYKYKISIILPCYNVEEYIDNAVSAILKQTFKDYEVIFINDGSTDNTLEVIKKHCCHNNFRVFDFQNQGVAQARNEGMRLSQGEYLYFMDPDDDMDETLLEVALEECEKSMLMRCSFTIIVKELLLMAIREIQYMKVKKLQKNCFHVLLGIQAIV